MPERDPDELVSAPLGIIGGTFDPVHYGHLRLAEEARQSLRLSNVRWIPAGQPPHRSAPRAAPADRLEMTRLAIAGNPAFLLDDAEVRSSAPSYTVRTLERLRAELGGEAPLVLLLGSDAFLGLATWRRWRELFELAHIAVAARPGFTLGQEALPEALAREWTTRASADAESLRQSPAGAIVHFTVAPLDISATAIRTQVGEGQSPRYLLPDPVLAYIESHHLYRRVN